MIIHAISKFGETVHSKSNYFNFTDQLLDVKRQLFVTYVLFLNLDEWEEKWVKLHSLDRNEDIKHKKFRTHQRFLFVQKLNQPQSALGEEEQFLCVTACGRVTHTLNLEK